MIGRRVAVIWWLLGAVILSAVAGPARAQTPPRARNILLLHQFGLNRPLHAAFDSAFIEAFQADGSAAINFYEEAIESDRFPPGQQQVFVKFLEDKYATVPIDVVVAVTDGAFAFAREHRRVFGNPPIVALGSAPGLIDSTADATGLEGGAIFGATIELALTLQPETREVFIIDGTRTSGIVPDGELRRQLAPFEGRLSFTVVRDVPLSELETRVARLPDGTVVYFLGQSMRDREQNADDLDAVSRIAKASRVPVYSFSRVFLGRGVLGGAMWRVEADAAHAAEMVKSILAGTPAAQIPVGRRSRVPMVDWVQMQRWQIPESRVPRDSIVLNRPTSFLETYRWYVIGGVLIFLAQLALIIGLLVERAWRRRAEHDAQRTREHLAHMTRVSAMGALAASLAHELNQPLTGILANARAAGHMLARDDFSRAELQDIVRDIVEDDKRAADVIVRIRELVSKRSTEREKLDLNEVVHGVAKLVASDAIIRKVSIVLNLAPGVLVVEGDRIQLQQVVMNLLLNALDAASQSDHLPRTVAIDSALSDRHTAHVVVRDNGSGLAEGTEAQVFDSFYTTKRSGMGMGLSIARSIVESHGGRIWAVNSADRGAEFHFTLPRPAAGARDRWATRRSA